MTTITFDAGTSNSKIIARFRSKEYPYEWVERHFVVSPFVRVLTADTYHSQLEWCEYSIGPAGVVSYINPSNNERVYWEIGQTATRPGLLSVGDRKFESLLAKILGFMGYLISQEADATDLVELELGTLLPLDEIEDRQTLAKWLRHILQPNVGFEYNGETIRNVQINKIDCKPEGFGVFWGCSAKKERTGVMIIGHSDSTWLYFENEKLNTKHSKTLPETGMHDFIQEINFPITYELQAAAILAQAGPSLNPKVLVELTQTKQDFEIEQLQQAIKKAKPQYWASQRYQFKFLSSMKIDQVLVTGGTAYYFAKELSEFFKNLSGIQVQTCNSLMKDFAEYFKLNDKSYLPYRFADCFGYYKFLTSKTRNTQLVNSR